MAAEPRAHPSSPAQPTLRTIDFSTNAPLRQASTMLRRAWLLDPPLSHAELADPATVQECLRAVCEALGHGIAADADEAKWDHELWRQHTTLKLLAPGGDVVVSASAEPPDLASVVSPWREEIYDVYRHVFSDLWRALLAGVPQEDEEARGALGRYDPGTAGAVSLVVLPAVEEEEEEEGAAAAGTEEKTTKIKKKKKRVDRPTFMTNTFLYPVWVNPRARVSFAADDGGGVQHVWVDTEQTTWTTGLWVRAGSAVSLATEMQDVEKDTTKVAAVFVTGHCDA